MTETTRPQGYFVQLTDPMDIVSARVVLSASGSNPDDKLMDGTPRYVKVGEIYGVPIYQFIPIHGIVNITFLPRSP